jgi:hypothetical protein
MARRTVLLAWVLGILFSIRLGAAERGGFELSVIVHGSPAAEYSFRGRTYVEALRGEGFSLRLHNPTAERVAVALSVDGLNVVDAKRTSAAGATKWILAPGQTVDIPGWQISGQAARRFFFTDTARSYAKWIGDTRNVGVIEAVFFREKTRPAPPLPLAPPPRRMTSRDSASRAPEAPTVAGIEEGATERRSAQADSGPSSQGSRRAEGSLRESDRFAATGIGERTGFPVQWVSFEEDPVSAATISLRYEYRRELVRLGVFPREDESYARDRGRGFEPEYAPDPGPER